MASIQQPHPVSNLRLEDLDSSKPQLDHLAAAAAQHGAQHISPAASLTPGIGGTFPFPLQNVENFVNYFFENFVKVITIVHRQNLNFLQVMKILSLLPQLLEANPEDSKMNPNLRFLMLS